MSVIGFPLRDRLSSFIKGATASLGIFESMLLSKDSRTTFGHVRLNVPFWIALILEPMNEKLSRFLNTLPNDLNSSVSSPSNVSLMPSSLRLSWECKKVFRLLKEMFKFNKFSDCSLLSHSKPAKTSCDVLEWISEFSSVRDIMLLFKSALVIALRYCLNFKFWHMMFFPVPSSVQSHWRIGLCRHGFAALMLTMQHAVMHKAIGNMLCIVNGILVFVWKK